MFTKYLTLIHGEEHNIKSKHKTFYWSVIIDPVPRKHRHQNSIVSNIRNDYTVTDKADGERYLMFIDRGKYFD